MSYPGFHRLDHCMHEMPYHIGQCCGAIANSVGVSVGLLLADYVTDSAFMATIIRASGWFSAAVFAAILARVAERWSRRSACLLGWILSTIGCASTIVGAMRKSVVFILAGTLLSGASTAAIAQARFALGDQVSQAERPEAFARLNISNIIGMIIGPVLSAVSVGIQHKFSINEYAASYIVAFLFMICGMLSVVRWTQPGSHASGSFSAMSDENRKRQFNIMDISILWVAVQFCMMGAMTVVPLQLSDRGMDSSLIGIVLSIHMAAMYCPSPLFARVYKDWRARIACQITLIILTVVILFALVAPSLVTLTLLLVVVGVTWSASQIAVTSEYSLLNEIPQARAIRRQGNLDTCANVASVCSIVVSGICLSLKMTHVFYVILLVASLVSVIFASKKVN